MSKLVTLEMKLADRPDWLIVLPMPYQPGVVDEAVADTGETINDAALASKESAENVVMPRIDKLQLKIAETSKFSESHNYVMEAIVTPAKV